MELWKRVTVGPDVFEALASEERISILKLLDQNKQMTGTDVANVLTISKSSAFKQLNRLARAGLVERMDEGRKWIYYRNTSKAERLLHPEDVTITLVLSAALAAVVVGLLVLLALNPILGGGATGGSAGGPGDPSLLILSNPEHAGSGIVIQVYAGSAELKDLAIFVAKDTNGAIVASAAQGAAPTSGQSVAPTLMTYTSPAVHAAAPHVEVKDLNGNGQLDKGDTITISGVADTAGCTLWVAGNGGAMASAPLSA